MVGRANAFTVAVIDSTTPDAIMEARLTYVADIPGGKPTSLYEIDPSRKYGGVTVDLDDPVEVIIGRA